MKPEVIWIDVPGHLFYFHGVTEEFEERLRCHVHQRTWADSLRRILKKCQSTSVKAAVLHFSRIPREEAKEIILAIKKTGTAVVVITADPEGLEEADGFIAKPFNAIELIQEVTRASKKRGLSFRQN